MRIDFHGKLVDEPEIRAGFIGCGSHAFRNIYPTFQFAPVRLVATCDLVVEKAQAFAAKFGAERAYVDYREMLDKEKLDAVFIVTGYDQEARPLYPPIARECLAAGLHVWMEKPPAATTAQVEEIQDAAKRSGKSVMVGLKKMFFPINRKVKELMGRPEFGRASIATIQYPQRIPTKNEFDSYLRDRKPIQAVCSFLDHICHPAALMVYLFGMPETLYYERSAERAGSATFAFASGVVVSVILSAGQSVNGGMERTFVASANGRHIVTENNVRLYYHQTPPAPAGEGYGNQPDFFTGTPGETSAYWEPEFSLGQLYNKGLFLLGYYDEVNEFARSIMGGRQLERGTLEQAWQVTRIFEGFAEGPGKVVRLGKK
jgi:predicted dehydrogenase